MIHTHDQSIATAAKRIYEARLRVILERTHRDDFVAIEPISGDYFTGLTLSEAIGTVNIMHTLNPAMVLFGGAMTFDQHNSELGRRFIAKVRDEVKARAFPIPAQRTIIDYASLGGDAGFIGSAGCIRGYLKRLLD